MTDPSDLLRVMLLEKVARHRGTVISSTGKSRWYDIPTGLIPEPRRSPRASGW